MATAEYRFRHGDGTWRWFEGVEKNLLHEPAVRAIVSNYRYITARKQSADALRESEDKNQILFRFHPEATWVYDRETLRFLAVNDAAMAQYGYSREEFLALTPKDIGALEEPAPLQEHSQLELKGPLRGPSFRHRKKDGT